MDKLDKRSLKHGLIRQLAAAFAVMGLIGALGAYAIGNHYVTQAYDRDLTNDLMTLAGHIEQVGQNWRADFPEAAQRWLLANEGEDVIYRIVDLRRNLTLVSHGDLPPLGPPEAVPPSNGQFKTQMLHGHGFRIGALTLPLEASQPTLLIQVGETLGRRERLAEHLMVGMLLLFLLIIMVATVLVWLGVQRALKPLGLLEQQVAKRSANDLTPLEPAVAPIEVRGLLLSVNQMMARVAQSVEAQRRFIANVAHQLRTPVAGIRLHAQLGLEGARQGVADGKSPHFDEINVASRRLSHVIDQLLVLARAEALPPAETVDLMTVVRSVIEARLPDALARRVDLGFEGPEHCAPIQGNRVLLEELLANLIDNAIRHGARNGTVTVSIEAQAGRLTLRVKDDGPGMANAEDLFQRFQRGDASNQMGAGLGLAIVKEISEAHGATVSCVTAPGLGVDMAVSFDAPSP